jgi:hypothetical protein
VGNFVYKDIGNNPFFLHFLFDVPEETCSL